MSGAKDPVIKLFGKTIQLQEIQARSEDSMGAVTNSSSGAAGVNVDNDSNHASTINYSADDCNTSTNGGYPEIDKDFRGKTTDSMVEDGGPTMSSEGIMNSDVRSSIKSSNVLSYEETPASKSSNTREEQKDKNDSQEETPKKPDKILPCPRCNSMETKFCYYNNYNVNQPRHFCKECQRYWTSGGTMRNMPIGAGRRKNKTSASHYHQLTVSGTFQNPQADILNGFRHPSFKPDAMFLTFGNDTPLCEPKISDLNHRDKSTQTSIRNEFHKPRELRIPVSYSNGENGSDQLSKPSKTKDDANNTSSQVGLQSFLPQIPFFSEKIWPLPWNLSQWSSPVTPPNLFLPVFAVPLYPAAACWGSTVSGTWNAPSLSQQPSSEDADSSSPTLGKHSREESMPKSNNSLELDEHIIEKSKETNLRVPKILRLDDPRDAAKSSIWTTLGIKNDTADSVRGLQLFKGFAAKDGEKIHLRGSSPVLQANPAALSRSLEFHESAA